jgi:putative transposase
MSREICPRTGKPYGVERVCKTLGKARSTHYERKARAAKTPDALPRKRGPKTQHNDEQVLSLIRDYFAATPFQMEGHRKVWAHFKFVRGLKIGKHRVLRIMRENQLLSPLRRPWREEKPHDGTILSERPNVMWGTDGTQVRTVEDGNVWIFAAIDHYTAECVGSHVCKTGDRFAAYEPISQGVTAQFGSASAQMALGVSLRHDGGPQYTADDFQRQIRYWGITPSPALAYEPETNGVIERFWRTLKEQCIYGRVFKNLEEVEGVVKTFIANYNQLWRIERLGFKTPIEARLAYQLNPAA